MVVHLLKKMVVQVVELDKEALVQEMEMIQMLVLLKDNPVELHQVTPVAVLVEADL